MPKQKSIGEAIQAELRANNDPDATFEQKLRPAYQKIINYYYDDIRSCDPGMITDIVTAFATSLGVKRFANASVVTEQEFKSYISELSLGYGYLVSAKILSNVEVHLEQIGQFFHSLPESSREKLLVNFSRYEEDVKIYLDKLNEIEKADAFTLVDNLCEYYEVLCNNLLHTTIQPEQQRLMTDIRQEKIRLAEASAYGKIKSYVAGFFSSSPSATDTQEQTDRSTYKKMS